MSTGLCSASGIDGLSNSLRIVVRKLTISIFSLLVLFAGCSQKPTDAEISAVLNENIPSPSVLKTTTTIEQITTDISSNGETVHVNFKSKLKLNQPLFTPGDYDAIAPANGLDKTKLTTISSKVSQLRQASRDTLASEIEVATRKLIFIVESDAVGSSNDWYGSFKAKKVVDKWVASDFKTEVEPKFNGRPRVEFDASAVESSRASEVIAALKDKQNAILQKLDTALQLQQKDAELAAKDAEIAAKEAEIASRNRVIAEEQKRARQMPVQADFRKANFGGTGVLRLQSSQAITVRVNVARGLQRYAREVQLVPGRVIEIGHLEGWGFQPGDRIMLSNPNTDPIAFSAP